MALNQGDKLRLYIRDDVLDAYVAQIEAIPLYEKGILIGSIMRVSARIVETDQEFVQDIAVQAADWDKITVSDLEVIFANELLRAT